jgi:flavin reductase (DIM6/NTAB) family NADH-FMN oxidoreductase RutF
MTGIDFSFRDPGAMSALERYRFLSSAVVPRPIAWVTTRSRDGVVNAAPFSFFNGVSASPALLSISVGRRRDGSPKDTLRNAEETGEMVVHVVPFDLRKEMVATSEDLPPEESELTKLGLATAPSVVVAPPRIAAAPAGFECRVERIVPFPRSSLIVGEIVCFFARDDLLVDGALDFTRLRPLGRLGGDAYLDPVTGRFDLPRP